MRWVLKNEEQLTEARKAEAANPWRCGFAGKERESVFPFLLPSHVYFGLSRQGGSFAVRSYSF